MVERFSKGNRANPEKLENLMLILQNSASSITILELSEMKISEEMLRDFLSHVWKLKALKFHNLQISESDDEADTPTVKMKKLEEVSLVKSNWRILKNFIAPQLLHISFINNDYQDFNEQSIKGFFTSAKRLESLRMNSADLSAFFGSAITNLPIKLRNLTITNVSESLNEFFGFVLTQPSLEELFITTELDSDYLRLLTENILKMLFAELENIKRFRFCQMNRGMYFDPFELKMCSYRRPFKDLKKLVKSYKYS